MRTVMHLVHKDSDARWHLEVAGTDIAVFDSKSDAEQEGEARGGRLWAQGTPAQLVVHREDGSVEHETTYGLDPARHEG